MDFTTRRSGDLRLGTFKRTTSPGAPACEADSHPPNRYCRPFRVSLFPENRPEKRVCLVCLTSANPAEIIFEIA